MAGVRVGEILMWESAMSEPGGEVNQSKTTSGSERSVSGIVDK